MINDKNLIRLTNTQIKPSADVLARAFQEDPLFSYFFPDEADRENKLPHLFTFMIRYAVLRGEVYGTSKYEGVAVWLPSANFEMSPWRMLVSGGLSMSLKIGIRGMVRMMRYMDYTETIHKRQAPLEHWYLPLIGVAPAFQGKGYASELLKPMFTRLDAVNLPCYLETLTQKDVSLYQHYGFDIVEEGTIPGTGIPVWAMLRKPSEARGSVS